MMVDRKGREEWKEKEAKGSNHYERNLISAAEQCLHPTGKLRQKAEAGTTKLD